MELRKVVFNKFIPYEYEVKEGLPYKTKVEGTGVFQKDFPNSGLFHCWGVVADGEGGTDSIAIVEMEDGTIEGPYLRDVKFVK